MPERVPAIKVLLLPKDTNALGTIFGGVILSHIDLASAVEARKTAPLRYVTKAMREVEFHAPVFVGDIVSFYTETCASAARRSPSRCSSKWSAGAAAGRAGQGDRGRGRAGGRSAPTAIPRRFSHRDDRRVRPGDRLQRRLRLRRARLCARAHPATSSSRRRATGRASRSSPSTVTADSCSRDPSPQHRRRGVAGAARAARAHPAASVSRFTKGMPLASGIGSSGASAVAARRRRQRAARTSGAAGRAARLRDGRRGGRLRGGAPGQRRARRSTADSFSRERAARRT